MESAPINTCRNLLHYIRICAAVPALVEIRARTSAFARSTLVVVGLRRSPISCVQFAPDLRILLQVPRFIERNHKPSNLNAGRDGRMDGSFTGRPYPAVGL